MSFDENYKNILDTVRSDIDSVIKNQADSIAVSEPLNTEILNILKAPSKHIRPLVSFLYIKALGCNITDAQINYQTAIELAHNASLIHDDIIDGSEKRRNTDTLNKKFTDKLAVIAGDYLLSIAFKKVLDIKIPELAQLFRSALEEMTKGEINQYFQKNKIPTLDEYIQKSEQKTAKLFETAVKGTMIIVNSFDTGEEFAKNFGIAFQIHDDLINCQTSKSDIKDGIYTAPVIFSNSTEVTQYGIEKTIDLLNNYIDAAYKNIEYLPENKYKSALKELLRIFKNE